MPVSETFPLESGPLDTIVLLVALSALPVLVVGTTSFVKMSVVLSALRNAIGAQGIPSGSVVTVLALVLTLHAMAPVGREVLACLEAPPGSLARCEPTRLNGPVSPRTGSPPAASVRGGMPAPSARQHSPGMRPAEKRSGAAGHLTTGSPSSAASASRQSAAVNPEASGSARSSRTARADRVSDARAPARPESPADGRAAAESRQFDIERYLPVVQHLRRGMPPVERFMRTHATREDREAFLLSPPDGETRGPTGCTERAGHVSPPTDAPCPLDGENLLTLIPAFMVSELRTASLFALSVYLPFVVIDLVVASLLIALGMNMVSPLTFSLPLKLLLFAATDAWLLVSRSLILCYR